MITITTDVDTSVTIKIADNGTGIEEAIMKRIFEPFYTTKGVGEGAGLGLSIAFSTIRQHKGQIQVLSTAGVGTEVIITLPLIQK